MCINKLYCVEYSVKEIKMKINQMGRSMIEMLGVLAIIGVLSVGAIAGYSKAMMKHKLNKQAEQLNFLFSGTMQYVGRLRGHAGSNYMNPTLAKLGVISEEMIKKEGDSEKYADVFGNTFDIYVIESNTITGNININFKINHSNNFEICQNMFSISGEYTENLNGVQVYNNSGISQTWYGPEDCKTYDTYPCIMDLTQTQILEVCSQLEPSTEWHFTIDWGVSTS